MHWLVGDTGWDWLCGHGFKGTHAPVVHPGFWLVSTDSEMYVWLVVLNFFIFLNIWDGWSKRCSTTCQRWTRKNSKSCLLVSVQRVKWQNPPLWIRQRSHFETILSVTHVSCKGVDQQKAGPQVLGMCVYLVVLVKLSAAGKLWRGGMSAAALTPWTGPRGSGMID